jgi:hypothetical protein
MTPCTDVKFFLITNGLSVKNDQKGRPLNGMERRRGGTSLPDPRGI